MWNLKLNLICLALLTGAFSFAAGEPVMRAENHQCLRCHADQTYSFYNAWTEKEERRVMNPFHIIDTSLYLNGVHHSFSCVDCHSMDYQTYPHARELKLEPLATCIDCHGGDETYAQYHFEEIDADFARSVHAVKGGENFTCGKCHNQHYYKVIARNSSRVADIVSADNQMCLSCHTNAIRYRLTSVHDYPDFNTVHEWLPNHELHFRSVRCIDCHTSVMDSLMVPHNILAKEKAVKNCSQCHSSNSMLQATLYKYENLQARDQSGLLGAISPSRPYIIGANQVPLFKILSVSLLLATLAGIALHALLRVFIRNKRD